MGTKCRDVIKAAIEGMGMSANTLIERLRNSGFEKVCSNSTLRGVSW